MSTFHSFFKGLVAIFVNHHKMKISSVIPPLVIITGFVLVLVILWEQEFKYYLASGDHSELAISSELPIDFLADERPSYLHFFSESCKNSRVNIQHIKQIFKRYNQEVDFYIVNNSLEGAATIRTKYDIPSEVEIIDDIKGEVGRVLNVKSQPYALIATTENHLYFGGNYNNKNGLCGAGDIIWSSPAVALKFLVEQKQPPLFPTYQLSFLGCEIANH